MDAPRPRLGRGVCAVGPARITTERERPRRAFAPSGYPKPDSAADHRALPRAIRVRLASRTAAPRAVAGAIRRGGAALRDALPVAAGGPASALPALPARMPAVVLQHPAVARADRLQRHPARGRGPTRPARGALRAALRAGITKLPVLGSRRRGAAVSRGALLRPRGGHASPIASCREPSARTTPRSRFANNHPGQREQGAADPQAR